MKKEEYRRLKEEMLRGENEDYDHAEDDAIDHVEYEEEYLHLNITTEYAVMESESGDMNLPVSEYDEHIESFEKTFDKNEN